MCGPTPNGLSETESEVSARASSVSETTILRGVVGSTAYGLARAGSDVDRLGIYVAPTSGFLGLDQVVQTRVTNKPDVTLHEVGKYLRLALKCNPSITELMWLDDYEVVTRWGQRILTQRKALLSENAVRSAYHNYATAQVLRLQRREAEGKEGFGDVPVNRTAKHARHCMRLLRQGRELLETGRLTIKVSDPEFYWQFDDASVEDIVRIFDVESRRFSNVKSILPAQPNLGRAELILQSIRRDFY